ncbi:MAG: O-antigen ligase family protein [Nostocoides sp.]
MNGAISQDRRHRPLAGLSLAVAAAAVAITLGGLAAHNPVVGLAAAGVVLAIGLTVAEPAIIPVLAMPASLVVARIGVGGTDLSVADLALFAATWPAVFLGGRPFSLGVRRILWAVAAYEAVTFLSVLATPTHVGAIEWVHQLFLLAGSLLVGWTVGRRGLARVGFTLMILAAVVIATLAIITAARAYSTGLFAPAYVRWPYPMHKNAIGTSLGVIAAALYTRPHWLRWPRWLYGAVTGYLVLGVVVAQSRQAIVGFLVAALVIVWRDPRRRRQRGWITLAAAGGLALVFTLVKDQVDSGNQHNSVYQRLDWFAQSLEMARTGLWFGHGNRWWYTSAFDITFQPPNAEIEVLTTTGILGLIAFLGVMLTILLELWRLPAGIGMFGFVAVASRLVQAQFDIFWLTVESSIPFILAGLALGVQEFERPSIAAVELDARRTRVLAAAGD